MVSRSLIMRVPGGMRAAFAAKTAASAEKSCCLKAETSASRTASSPGMFSVSPGMPTSFRDRFPRSRCPTQRRASTTARRGLPVQRRLERVRQADALPSTNAGAGAHVGGDGGKIRADFSGRAGVASAGDRRLVAACGRNDSAGRGGDLAAEAFRWRHPLFGSGARRRRPRDQGDAGYRLVRTARDARRRAAAAIPANAGGQTLPLRQRDRVRGQPWRRPISRSATPRRASRWSSKSCNRSTAGSSSPIVRPHGWRRRTTELAATACRARDSRRSSGCPCAPLRCRSPALNPLDFIGDRRWIVVLPRPGDADPGKLIINPDKREMAGFKHFPVALQPGAAGHRLAARRRRPVASTGKRLTKTIVSPSRWTPGRRTG